ncbi:uncharacterized protein LOC123680356 [Harmonia axyridis]|uniref:uncharacterized protein LOC123680356 n=1 Tax=Harmonia axyridis TaxID=115357 RepID=UPI001E278422|nr:uncharacterized protein LOC123680356 [Harmonia axyridis]
MKHIVLISSVFIFFILVAPSFSFVLLDHVRMENQTYGFQGRSFGDPREKKHKLHLMLPLIITALMIKSIIFPMIIKAMAVMTSVAVLLSLKSLIISSIIGYAKLAQSYTAPNVKIVYVDKKPLVKQGWSPPEEYIVPPIFRSKFSYVPRTEGVDLDYDGPKVIDHYHSFVDK